MTYKKVNLSILYYVRHGIYNELIYAWSTKASYRYRKTYIEILKYAPNQGLLSQNMAI